jgi:DNA-binding LacI/PurR family transcriptional regulator
MRLEVHARSRKRKPVTLKTIAEHVGLAPCSVSAVLNNSPAAQGIPQHTKDRVLRAALQLKYQPNFAARALRTNRTHSVALLASDLGRANVAPALAGIEQSTRQRGYLLMIATWDGTSDCLSDHLLQLRQRGVEGLILMDAHTQPKLSLPMVVIETDEKREHQGLMPDGRDLRAQGESAAHTLLDQVEAFVRIEKHSQPMFWGGEMQNNRSLPVS